MVTSTPKATETKKKTKRSSSGDTLYRRLQAIQCAEDDTDCQKTRGEHNADLGGWREGALKCDNASNSTSSGDNSRPLHRSLHATHRAEGATDCQTTCEERNAHLGEWRRGAPKCNNEDNPVSCGGSTDPEGHKK